MNVQTTIFLPVSESQYNQLKGLASINDIRVHEGNYYFAALRVEENLPFTIGEDFYLNTDAWYLGVVIRSKFQEYSPVSRWCESHAEIEAFSELLVGYDARWNIYVNQAILDARAKLEEDLLNQS